MKEMGSGGGMARHRCVRARTDFAEDSKDRAVGSGGARAHTFR